MNMPNNETTIKSLIDTKKVQDVDTFAEKINAKLENINDKYFEMADELCAAKESLGRHYFGLLLDSIKMSATVASRHMENAKCPRLKKYRQQLRHVVSWSVLNEIRKLKGFQFVKFAEDNLAEESDVEITRKLVLDYRVEEVKETLDALNHFNFSAVTINISHPEFSVDKVQPVIDAVKTIQALPWADITFGDDFRAKLDEFIVKKQEKEALVDSDDLGHKPSIPVSVGG